MKRMAILTVCLAIGCGDKTITLSSSSKSIVRKFEEHLPRHKTQTFEALCKDVEKLHESKKITDEEYQALHDVCGPASTGQWEEAKTNLQSLLESTSEKK